MFVEYLWFSWSSFNAGDQLRWTQKMKSKNYHLVFGNNQSVTHEGDQGQVLSNLEPILKAGKLGWGFMVAQWSFLSSRSRNHVCCASGCFQQVFYNWVILRALFHWAGYFQYFCDRMLFPEQYPPEDTTPKHPRERFATEVNISLGQCLPRHSMSYQCLYPLMVGDWPPPP